MSAIQSKGLPESVADLAEEFGLSFVVRLVDHFGGVELKIPHKLHNKHPLMVFGEEDAQALCAYCPGDTILVPVNLMTGRRGGLVAKLQQMGFNRARIARDLGISQRHVRRLANDDGNDPDQGDLF